jgi:hypothetical protein
VNASGATHLLGNSCLWRGLSPKNRSHLLIFACCAVAFAAVTVVQMRDGRSAVEAGSVALNAAVMLFLCWAIGRELDPDNPRSAFVVTAVGALILLAGSAPAGASVGVLLALRIVIRSTGKRPSVLDLVAIPLLAGAFAWMPGGWVGGVAMTAALVWDTLLPDPGPRRGYSAAGATLAVTAIVTVYRQTFDAGFDTSGVAGWVAIGAAVVAFVALKHYVPQSRSDRSSRTIDSERLRAGRILALGTGLVAFAAFGTGCVPLLAAVWASLIGIAIFDRLLPSQASPAT